jgi:hypothetical protein
MRVMAELLRQQRPPSDVMGMAEQIARHGPLATP